MTLGRIRWDGREIILFSGTEIWGLKLWCGRRLWILEVEITFYLLELWFTWRCFLNVEALLGCWENFGKEKKICIFIFFYCLETEKTWTSMEQCLVQLWRLVQSDFFHLLGTVMKITAYKHNFLLFFIFPLFLSVFSGTHLCGEFWMLWLTS